MQDAPGSCIFPCPSSGIIHFSNKSGSLHWVFRGEGLVANCPHGYQSVTASRPSWWTKARNFMKLNYSTHTNNFILFLHFSVWVLWVHIDTSHCKPKPELILSSPFPYLQLLSLTVRSPADTVCSVFIYFSHPSIHSFLVVTPYPWGKHTYQFEHSVCIILWVFSLTISSQNYIFQSY